MASRELLTALSSAFATALTDVQIDNVDPHRLRAAPTGVSERVAARLGNRLTRAMRRVGFIPALREEAPATARDLAEILYRLDGLGALYDALADEASRRWLVAILAYRALGHRRVKLPRNAPHYWRTVEHAKRDLRRRQRSVPIGYGFLDEYDLTPDGIPIRLHAHLLSIVNTFLLGEYRYANGNRPIAPRPGDVVIDGGGCWGDTALCFAHQVGPTGRVLTFEFVPENLAILRTNLDANPALRACIEVREEALWRRSGETLCFDDDGPASTVRPSVDSTGTTVPTVAIDDLVRTRAIDRVDFIKLDVEGAELAVLEGAAETIRRDRPTLAVSLYHRLDDFVEIPAFLAAAGVDYELYLDHFTIHGAETVLFAQAPERQ
jgi:FkbM family methyltransferase